jgi:hypothetical protein
MNDRHFIEMKKLFSNGTVTIKTNKGDVLETKVVDGVVEKSMLTRPVVTPSLPKDILDLLHQDVKNSIVADIDEEWLDPTLREDFRDDKKLYRDVISHLCVAELVFGPGINKYLLKSGAARKDVTLLKVMKNVRSVLTEMLRFGSIEELKELIKS